MVILVLTAISLPALKSPNSMCSELLKLLSSAPWLLWHMLISWLVVGKAVTSLTKGMIVHCHMLSPSLTAMQSDSDAIRLECIKSVVCQQLLLLWLSDRRHMISPCSRTLSIWHLARARYTANSLACFQSALLMSVLWLRAKLTSMLCHMR